MKFCFVLSKERINFGFEYRMSHCLLTNAPMLEYRRFSLSTHPYTSAKPRLYLQSRFMARWRRTRVDKENCHVLESGHCCQRLAQIDHSHSYARLSPIAPFSAKVQSYIFIRTSTRIELEIEILFRKFSA